MQYVAAALIPSLLLFGTAIAVCWYVVRAWQDWRDTGELGTGNWQPRSYLGWNLRWPYRWPSPERIDLREVYIRKRWVLFAWLALCIAVAFVIATAAVAWLFVGAHWGSDST